MNIKKYGWLLILAIALQACDDSSDEEPLLEDEPTNQNVDIAQLLDLVNDVRTSGCTCGSTDMPATTSVSWNQDLAEAALSHSQDMDDNSELTHTGSDGSSAGDRINRTGYDWRTYGENVAWNYPNEAAVIQAWIDSEGHCKNIMNPNFQEMGVGKAGAYWTQVFATPR